jgi:hypothetical protein
MKEATTMTKKISPKEANRFLTRNNKMNWTRTIEITKLCYGYEIVESVKWWVFALLYIPELIVSFFGYVWCEGLKYFSLPERPMKRITLYDADREQAKEVFEIVDEIWEKA